VHVTKRGVPPIPRLGHARQWSHLRAILPPLGALLVAVVLVSWGFVAADPALQRLLGRDDAAAGVLTQDLTITVSPSTQTFSPQVAAVVYGSRIRFSNALDIPVDIRTTSLAPTQFNLTLAAHAQASVRLDRPGLYQYYDALTASPRRIVAGNTVFRARSKSVLPRQGWIAVVGAVPSLQEQLTVPASHDLFSPRVVVAVVGSTIVVTNHDNESHNFVVDPASPAGAAFIVAGSDTEGPTGWRRVLVVQQAGLYHVYCTLHTRLVGLRDGWQVVVPRMTASGFADNDPMEAWIIVLPAVAKV
jgi:plastocyanin